MYNSQYYTCEQIDQRLLQGYLDDYNTENNTSLTKAQFLAKLGSILGVWQGVDEEPTAGSNNFVKSGGVYLSANSNVIAIREIIVNYTTVYPNVTMTYGTLNLTIVGKTNNNWITIPEVEEPITLNANHALVYNTKTQEVLDRHIDGIKPTDIVLFVCALGYLYSPIPQIDSAISIHGSNKEAKAILTTERNFSLSITQSGNNVIINSMSAAYIVGGENNNNYLGIPNVENVTVNNTQCLVFNQGNGSVSTKSASTLLANDTVLFVCIFGKLYSPIPQLNDKLYEIYHPAEVTKDDIGILNDKTSIVACVSGSSGGIKCTYTAGSAAYSTIFNCNSFILAPIKKSSNVKYYVFPAQSNITINNTQCLVFDVETHSASVKSINNFDNIKEVLICVNFYGTLYSPIQDINNQLSRTSPAIKRTDCIVATERENFSLSVSQSGNNVILNMSGILVSGIVNGHNFANIPAQENITINNTQCLVFHNNADDGSASAMGTAEVIALSAVRPYHTILFVCLFGKLYSPISQLNDKLYEIYHPSSDIPISYVDINLAPDETTPNLIANTIRNITDNSTSKRYRIHLAAGTYQEIDIITKDYVDIIGVKPDNTIIYTDGHATYNSPADYTFPDYSNTPVNEIPEANKHTFWHLSNSKISNVTIKATYCKYPVHQDGEGTNFNAIIENCVIVDSGCYAGVLGVGIRGTQKLSYINTSFVIDINRVQRGAVEATSFNLHNWNNRGSNAEMLFDHCSFFNCKDISFTELGSTQNDTVKFISCYIDNDAVIRYTATDYYYRKDGQQVQDIEEVPYSYSINTSGSNIPIIRTQNRKTYNFNTVGKHVLSKKASTQINFGEAVTFAANGEVVSLTIESADFMTAMCNSDNNQILVNDGKVHYVKAASDTYAVGDMLTISNGIFQKATSGGVAKVKYVFTDNNETYLEIEKI